MVFIKYFESDFLEKQSISVYKNFNFAQYQLKMAAREGGGGGEQSGTVLREMLIEATFNQTNF